ncbi:MAG: PAS domain S-box protein [Deltaproteobacteria bacterium]|nr:PAS domain S-box protein [Deltaproteobacteria bacterium]
MTTQQTETSDNLPEILIVEDSPVATELLRRTLTRAGYAVSVAQDGEEGLQAARAHRPALVMSDINMPVMNGYQLCRAIKFDDDLWNIPLMLCTVLSGPEDIIEAINSGADAYIVKPFVEANLLERIRSLLDAPIERRRAEERRTEVVSYNGKRHSIAGSGQQILNLLFSLYENSLNQNRELTIIQSQLNLLNEDLDGQVRERTKALGQSEARFRNIVETTSDLIWEVNENGVYTYVSPRIHDLLGYRPEEVIGKTPFDLMPAEEAQRMAELFAANISARETFVNHENINLHRDGHQVILETSAVPVIDQDGNFRGYHGIDRDITERKHAEEALARVNRALRTLSATNQTLLRARDEQTLMEEMCRVMVEIGGYLLAWVGFAEDDKRVRVVASRGADADYLDSLNITWDETASGRGPTGTAIRRGTPVTCSNVQTDPDYGPWRERGQRYGFASSVALPLRLDGAVIGTLNIYAVKPDVFDEDAVELLNEAAVDLAYGITMRRAEAKHERTRADVQRLEKRNTLILNSVGEGIFGLDREGRATFINPAGAAMLQLTTEEIIGQDMHALHHHTKADGTPYPRKECPIYAAYRDGVVHHVADEIFWKKDGTSFFVDYVSTPIRDERGELAGAVVSFSDITERKKSEEFIKNILECVDEGFIIIDRDFRILSANKAYSKIVEMPIDKIIGKYCYEIVHHKSAPCSEPERDCAVQKVFATGKSHSAIHQCEDAKGRVAYIDMKAYPYSKDNSGEVITAIVTLVDITEKYKLEDQLRQSQKMEAIGTLAGGIAHDFNNMLAPILGYSEMALARISPSDPLAADLQQVITAAGRAKGLVQQILAFSRQAPQERKPLQPQLVVQEALKLLRASLPSTIEIREEIPADCGTILADPTQLHQIIMNLGTNAYHAMQQTGGVLAVRLTKITIGEDNGRVPSSELAPGEYVMIDVSDTGCGMEQKTMAHIFDPYFTTKAKGEGTGLGLAVVHGIVKSYQGHIAVYSEPGKGSSFHVYLPRIAEAPSLTEAVHSEAIPTGTERLLVVDDEEVLATMLQLILQGLGYQVRSSCNSLEALALIEQDPMAVDLLITDMTMPYLTGFELAQKALALRPDLPIILCTGFSDLINKEQVQALGIRSYLMKPVSIQDLGQAVRKALDAKREIS